MVEGRPPLKLTYKRVAEQGYRVLVDGVGIGSVTMQTKHTQNNKQVWHWGVDGLPLYSHAGRPPSGEIETCERELEAGFRAALAAFKAAFESWQAALDQEKWIENYYKLKYPHDHPHWQEDRYWPGRRNNSPRS